MKNIIILFLIFFSSVSYAQLDVYGRYTLDGKIEPVVTVFGTKKVSEKFKLTYFTLIQENWSEALVGVSYSLKDWIGIGLSAGIEHNPAIYRFGASVWLGKNRTSLLMLGEKGEGKNNYWYKVILAYEVSKTFTFSALTWRFHGTGPMLKYEIKKLDSKVWIMPAYDFEFEVKRLLCGVSVKI